MTGRDDLARELDALAERSSAPIRSWRVRGELAPARDRAIGWLWFGPACLVVFELFRLLRGLPASSWWSSPWSILTLSVLLPPLVVFAWHLWCVRRRSVSKRDGLGAVDQSAGLKGRLVTADEFLACEVRNGFMEAALDDAATRLDTARATTLRLDATQVSGRGTRWGRVATAVGLLVIAFGLGRLSIADSDVVSPAVELDRRVAATVKPDVARVDTVVSAGEPAKKPLTPAEQADSDSERSTDNSQLGSEVKESRGNLGAGRPAEASPSEGSSNSKAAPTNQGQAAKIERRPKPGEKKLTPPKPGDASPPPPEKLAREQAGATAGRGSSRGSNKNPATSDWSSKDQVTNPEDESIDDDQEIEDEEDEQESRGGIQPNLRDRKPPVNRDLRIGFGNRKNPDANGRGGASEQKKSRGVASLVLGVPIPDRIKGQPNRGKTKITQERIEPKAEDADPLAAQARMARDRPIGTLPRYELKASLRRLIRNYFLETPAP